MDKGSLLQIHSDATNYNQWLYVELDRKEAILAKLKVEEDMEDIDELEDLESKLLGSMEIEIPTS